MRCRCAGAALVLATVATVVCAQNLEDSVESDHLVTPLAQRRESDLGEGASGDVIINARETTPA